MNELFFITEAILVMCRTGSVEKKCTIEDLQKTGFADHFCTGNTISNFYPVGVNFLLNFPARSFNILL